MSKEIIHRPSVAMDENVIDSTSNTIRVHVVFALVRDWARHLEARLAKYETFAPSPMPGATVVTNHTQFDPDRRPKIMALSDISIQKDETRHNFGCGWGGMASATHMRCAVDWAHHLEAVREGLQRQLGHFEREQKQRLESELEQREADERDRSDDN